jgi:hypothetical protein
MMFFAAVNRSKNRDRANRLADVALSVASGQPGSNSKTLKQQIEALTRE